MKTKLDNGKTDNCKKCINQCIIDKYTCRQWKNRQEMYQTCITDNIQASPSTK